MRTYITYEEALRIITSQNHLLPEETVSLFEAHNRVLREDLIADRDDPPAPVSAMDGYGVRGEDVEGAPVELKVIGEIPAGKVPEIELKRGEAVKLFTGSLIPRGVNTVVPVEYTEERRGKVLIRKPLKKWQNVRPRGENYRKGEVLVERGTVLGAPEIGIASSVGKPFLRVSSRPRVGIIATGSEVFEPWEEVNSPSQIRNTNAYTLYSLIKEAGGEPVYLGKIKDLREDTATKINEGLRNCDVVITTGGISMGDYDFVKEVVEEVGIDVLFYKVKVKPGKPVLFGRKGEKFFFGLPGFPVSTVVSFNLFVFPLLRKIEGAVELLRPTVKALLKADFKRKKAERREFVRVEISFEDGKIWVTPLKSQGSGVLTSLVGKRALMVVPEGTTEIKANSEVETILIK